MDKYKEEHVYKQPEIQRFLKKAENVGMTKREKAFVWASLSKRMSRSAKTAQVFPSPISMEDIKEFQEKALEYVPEVPQAIKSKFSWNIFVYASKRTVAASMVAALVLATFGTTFAAEEALPGDALYTVKINITENVQSLVAVGDTAQAKLAVTFAKKRLEEAEALSAKGQLNAQTQAIIETNFKKHTQTIKEKVIELKKQNEEEAVEDVVTNLASGINAHETILTTIKEKTDETTGSHIESLLDNVNDEVQQNLAEIITVDASSTISIDPAASSTDSGTTKDDKNDDSDKDDNISTASSTDADSGNDVNKDNDADPTNVDANIDVKNDSAKTLKITAVQTKISADTAATAEATPQITARLTQKVDDELVKRSASSTTELSEKDISELQQEVSDAQKQALDTIAQVKTALSNASGSTDSILNVQAQTKLSWAEKTVAKGDAYFKKGDISKALTAYNLARSLAVEAQTFIDVHAEATDEVKNLLKR